MLNDRPVVDICILTYKRPQMLGRLLKSIFMLDISCFKLSSLIIIDNDRNGSACEISEAFGKSSGWVVRYIIEPEQNIALARNRALSFSLSPYVAFVDDDETVSVGWMCNLLSAMHVYGADIVFGPVISVFPDGSPQWLLNKGFYERKRYKTGVERSLGGAGNVLLRKGLYTKMRFDQEFGLSGGEDTDYFYRCKDQGAKMIWCDEAEVYEENTIDRMSVIWLLRRAFREGLVFSKIMYPKMRLATRLVWVAKRTLAILLLLILPLSLMVAAVRGPYIILKVLIIVARNAGQLAGLFATGFRFYQ